MNKINWGIIGLGKIALKFADAFKNVKNSRLISVSSKNTNKLEHFKKNFQIKENYCFNKYEDLLKNKDIDIVYIALPNSLHHEWAIECIKNEKNILVEKPATLNYSEIKNIKNNLNKKNLFFAEGLMYLYHPQILRVIKLIKENTIGKIISMNSCFGINILTKKSIFGLKRRKKIDKKSRLFNKDLGGGAILDLGCYPVSLSVLIGKLSFGFDYEKIKVLKKKIDIIETGVDVDSYAELDFGNGFVSSVNVSFKKNLGMTTKIKGEKGELIIDNTWLGLPSLIKVISRDKGVEKIEIDSYDNIYSHEIEIISKCLLENKKQPDFPGLTINDTLENMKIIDKWLN